MNNQYNANNKLSNIARDDTSQTLILIRRSVVFRKYHRVKTARDNPGIQPQKENPIGFKHKKRKTLSEINPDNEEKKRMKGKAEIIKAVIARIRIFRL